MELTIEEPITPLASLIAGLKKAKVQGKESHGSRVCKRFMRNRAFNKTGSFSFFPFIFSSFNIILLSGLCIGDLFPEWKWINSMSGMKKRLEKNLNDLRKICDGMINERLQNNESKTTTTTTTMGNNGEDFLDILLQMQQRDDLEVPITDENIKALVMDMFEGGTDTTTATLEWTMIEKVNETHLQHLHYLKVVVKEALRLHPPTPLLAPRESMDNCILDGFEIPVKTRVVINAFAIGGDPKSWEDPLVYNLERFIDDQDNKNGSVVHIDQVKDQELKFVQFKAGRRRCPGFAFGLATIEIAFLASCTISIGNCLQKYLVLMMLTLTLTLMRFLGLPPKGSLLLFSSRKPIRISKSSTFESN
ncbi:hypothetical protein FEM48_Zijuj11G0151400 [Ziziphus jujuba var. spinosa]|uniref:Uncharacterized protein n=1 Tax=Ziziphus jujuba var. spinosa TaxID=714518 RepID=A0A978UJN4_ZIZJJ|nr:hypothetical protein FEM48_Zijuj11G0151400 [Ziziphus jujuba var. spinosa]